jgi:hypothetical protein
MPCFLCLDRVVVLEQPMHRLEKEENEEEKELSMREEDEAA